MKLIRCIIWIAVLLSSLLSSLSQVDSSEYNNKKKKFLITGHPILGYTPETRFIFGVGGIILFPDSTYSLYAPSKDQSLINPYFMYTLNSQIKFATNSELNIKNIYTYIHLEYTKFPDYYYGIGNKTTNINESYTLRMVNCQLIYLLKMRFNDNIQSGLISDFKYHYLLEYEEGGKLQTDSSHIYKENYSAGIGPSMRLDFRDNMFAPNSGFYLYTHYTFHPSSRLNTHSHNKFFLDLRNYIPVVSKNNIFAYQAKVNFMFRESLPFYLLARLGGDFRLRGIRTNRYIDTKMVMVQFEYRRKITNTFSGVVFAGTGKVANNIVNINFNDLKYSCGGGIRIIFKNMNNIRFRIDYGYGTDKQSGIYVGLHEVF